MCHMHMHMHRHTHTIVSIQLLQFNCFDSMSDICTRQFTLTRMMNVRDSARILWEPAFMAAAGCKHVEIVLPTSGLYEAIPSMKFLEIAQCCRMLKVYTFCRKPYRYARAYSKRRILGYMELDAGAGGHLHEFKCVVRDKKVTESRTLKVRVEGIYRLVILSTQDAVLQLQVSATWGDGARYFSMPPRDMASLKQYLLCQVKWGRQKEECGNESDPGM